MREFWINKGRDKRGFHLAQERKPNHDAIRAVVLEPGDIVITKEEAGEFEQLEKFIVNGPEIIVLDRKKLKEVIDGMDPFGLYKYSQEEILSILEAKLFGHE